MKSLSLYFRSTKGVALLIFSTVFLCTLACGVNDEPDPIELNTAGKALTKAPWKLVSYKNRKTVADVWKDFETDSTTLTDSAAFRMNVAVCYPDDIYTFKANGIAVRDNGLISCFNSESTVDTGTWKLDETDKKLTLTFFGIPITWNVRRLTADSVQLETPVPGEFHQAIFVH